MVACSAYFDAMFSIGMTECTGSSLDLPGLSSTGLQAFAYTGHVEINKSNIVEILTAASYLQVTEAVQLCEDFLERAISIESCVWILDIAELFMLPRTIKKARHFILQNFEKFAAHTELFNLNCDQLAGLLVEDTLRVRSERDLLRSVLKWIHHNDVIDGNDVTALMRKVRLPIVSGLDEELDGLRHLMAGRQSTEECSRLLAEAKRYQSLVQLQPTLQTCQTQVRGGKVMAVVCQSDCLVAFDVGTGELATNLRRPPVPVINSSACAVENFMYVCGGRFDNDMSDEATKRCFQYDPRFNSWFELPSMIEARSDFVLNCCVQQAPVRHRWTA